MSHFQPKKNDRWISARYALMSVALLCVPCKADDLLKQDINRKSENVEVAQKYIMEGDSAYGASRYEDALKKYSQAFALIPSAPLVNDLRDAAAERYATAAVARSQELNRKGDIAGALALCELVLAPDVAPNYGPAMAMRDQLRDPIRTNPALTAEHAKDVDQVRRLLYEADGYYQLGQFDSAKKSFNAVLTIDAHNTAARRGLEKVNAAISAYQRSAYDHARVESLGQVEALWESPVPPAENPLLDNPTEGVEIIEPLLSDVMSKMVIPNVNLEDASLGEAIDFLRSQSRTLDPSAKTGLNIIINLGDDPQGPSAAILSKKIDLQLRNVPFAVALQMICDDVGVKYTVGEYAITIRPQQANVRELLTRAYKVSPTFISSESAAAQKSADDIFSQGGAEQESLVTKKKTAVEKLTELGISFPKGSFANFDPRSSTLTVKNTMDAHDLVQAFVDEAAQVTPIQVSISIKVIRIQNVELQELSMDWIANDISLGGGVNLGGGSTSSGNPINDMTNLAFNPAPATSGLSSGNTAAVPSSIDELIRNATSGFGVSPTRAPAFLSVLGNNLNGAQVATMMRGFDQKKGIDVMVKPATIARSGQTSKIEVIQEFIYPTVYEPPQIPQQVAGVGVFDPLSGQGADITPAIPIAPANPTEFTTRNVGVTLEVMPVVSADRKYVDLTIDQQFVSFDGFVNYGTPINGGGATGTDFFDVPLGAPFNVNRTFGEITPNRILMPIFSKIGSNTTISINDGATIVFGGMVEERVQKVEDKLPILGDIPFFGKAFHSNVLRPIRTTVLIMATVDIQDPSGGLYRAR